MIAAGLCAQCRNPVEQTPRHPDPGIVRNRLCRRCWGESHWAWLMWRGRMPGVEPVAFSAVTAARPRAIAAVLLASMLRRNPGRWLIPESGPVVALDFTRDRVAFGVGEMGPDTTTVRMHTWTVGPGGEQ